MACQCYTNDDVEHKIAHCIQTEYSLSAYAVTANKLPLLISSTLSIHVFSIMFHHILSVCGSKWGCVCVSEWGREWVSEWVNEWVSAKADPNCIFKFGISQIAILNIEPTVVPLCWIVVTSDSQYNWSTWCFINVPASYVVNYNTVRFWATFFTATEITWMALEHR